MKYRICDVLFEVECEFPQVLDFLYAFSAIFKVGDAARCSVRFSVSVRLDGDGSPIPADAEKLLLHSSKSFPEWNIVAYRTVDCGIIRLWLPGKRIYLELNHRTKILYVSSIGNCNKLKLGEMVFHFTRGLALYQRGREYKSIHASAVSGDGGAVLFSGEESAGKSTLFCKACIDYGYRPLASDRVFLNVEDDHYRAESWPGYVSLCEGTLLDYDLLHAAAIAYEAGDYKYTTQKYDRQLKKTYVKEYGAKRMYPMHWFENATGVEFIRNSGVRAVCFLKLRPGMGSTAVRKLDLNAKMDWDLCTNLLMRNSMDFSEDAFLPWHNYGLPDCGGVDCEMFRRCGASVYVGDIDPLYLDQFFISINDT